MGTYHLSLVFQISVDVQRADDSGYRLLFSYELDNNQVRDRSNNSKPHNNNGRHSPLHCSLIQSRITACKQIHSFIACQLLISIRKAAIMTAPTTRCQYQKLPLELRPKILYYSFEEKTGSLHYNWFYRDPRIQVLKNDLHAVHRQWRVTCNLLLRNGRQR